MSEVSLSKVESEQGKIEQETRYRRLFETALEGILFVDAAGRISSANHRFARMLGYGAAEKLIGEDYICLLFDEDIEAARGRWSERMQGVQGEFELRLRRKDGSACWVLAHVTIEKSSNQEFVGTFSLFTDISERKRAIEDLQARNREIVTIMESMTDAFASFDLQWNFTYTNPAAERILGRAASDLLGKCLWDEFSGSRETVVFNEYHRAVREQATVAFEVYYGALLGWFEVRAYPSPTGLAAYFRDISERKAADRERDRAAEEKANLLEELRAATERQRRFLREMLYSLTEGRLRLCDVPSELPARLSQMSEEVELSAREIYSFRKTACMVASSFGLDTERVQDLETGIGEAAMNAVRHAGGGTATVCADPESGTIQIWIADQGTGISEDNLHRATLEKGFSSAGTLGHGFWLMLKTCDRIFLLTGSRGTTIVLEQERAVPEPIWIRDFDQTLALKRD